VRPPTSATATPIAAAHLAALGRRWFSQIATHRVGNVATIEFEGTVAEAKHGDLNALVMFVVDATKPFSSPATMP